MTSQLSRHMQNFVVIGSPILVRNFHHTWTTMVKLLMKLAYVQKRLRWYRIQYIITNITVVNLSDIIREKWLWDIESVLYNKKIIAASYIQCSLTPIWHSWHMLDPMNWRWALSAVSPEAPTCGHCQGHGWVPLMVHSDKLHSMVNQLWYFINIWILFINQF